MRRAAETDLLRAGTRRSTVGFHECCTAGHRGAGRARGNLRHAAGRLGAGRPRARAGRSVRPDHHDQGPGGRRVRHQRRAIRTDLGRHRARQRPDRAAPARHRQPGDAGGPGCERPVLRWARGSTSTSPAMRSTRVVCTRRTSGRTRAIDAPSCTATSLGRPTHLISSRSSTGSTGTTTTGTTCTRVTGRASSCSSTWARSKRPSPPSRSAPDTPSTRAESAPIGTAPS